MGGMKLSRADGTSMSATEYEDSAAANSDLTVFNNQFAVKSSADTSETTYTCDWAKWLGYYKALPELQSMTDKMAIWTVGKGVKADEKTLKILEKIKGFGKDSFNTIMYNQERTSRIAGDSYAEIIETKRGELRNLKPLNPGSIKIVADGFGIIERYEQYHQGKLVRNFDPDD